MRIISLHSQSKSIPLNENFRAKSIKIFAYFLRLASSLTMMEKCLGECVDQCPKLLHFVYNHTYFEPVQPP